MRHLTVAILLSILVMGAVIAVPIIAAIFSGLVMFLAIVVVIWFVIKVITCDESK